MISSSDNQDTFEAIIFHETLKEASRFRCVFDGISSRSRDTRASERSLNEKAGNEIVRCTCCFQECSEKLCDQPEIASWSLAMVCILWISIDPRGYYCGILPSRQEGLFVGRTCREARNGSYGGKSSFRNNEALGPSFSHPLIFASVDSPSLQSRGMTI